MMRAFPLQPSERFGLDSAMSVRGSSSQTGHSSGLFGIDEATSLLAAIVVSSSDGIVSKTLDGTITSWNLAAFRLLGYSAPEMIGRSIRILIPADRYDEEDRILSRIAAGERVDNYETVRLCKDGRAIEVSVTISPIRDQRGTIIGASKIIRDITEKKRSENAEALLAAIVTSSSDPILSKTLDGTVTSWNTAAEGLFGYSDLEIIGQSIRTLVPADRQDEEDRILSRIAAGERVESFETVRLCKDGRMIEVSVTISPVRNQSGTIIGASKIIRDITEKKRAAQQIHLLLSEVNHRAKNILSVVQAIARQTVASNPTDYLATFLERIQALSASQDLLIRDAWRGTYIEDLVHVQLEAFKDLIGTRVASNGQRLQLVPAAAQTMGLALHELVTNASKHGALSNSEGCIDIAWRHEGDQFFFSWAERNGPPVEVPSRSGFGTKILSSIVKLSLDAQVEMDYLHSGFIWHIRCPVSKALVTDANFGGIGDGPRVDC
jgi:PAS domain S-box-containing protein